MPIPVPIPTLYAQAPEEKSCPFCGETILAIARKCKHCGETIDVVLRAAEEAKRAAEHSRLAAERATARRDNRPLVFMNAVGGASSSSSSSAAAATTGAGKRSCSCTTCLTVLLLGFLGFIGIGILGQVLAPTPITNAVTQPARIDKQPASKGEPKPVNKDKLAK